MVQGGQRTSAIPFNVVGALRSNALSGGTRPERVLVFLSYGRSSTEHSGAASRDREAGDVGRAHCEGLGAAARDQIPGLDRAMQTA